MSMAVDLTVNSGRKRSSAPAAAQAWEIRRIDLRVARETWLRISRLIS